MQNKEDNSTMYQPQRPVFRVVTSASEAEEHLRVIRQAMERSTRHSTLSGLSGVLIGLLCLGGCALTSSVTQWPPVPQEAPLFVGVWAGVLLIALLIDYLLTKRRAAQVGKTAFSPLGRHLARAAAPGLLTATALSLFYLVHPDLIGPYIYGVWMLCYAVSLLSVGMFSLKEVSVLGWAFLAAGTITLLLPVGWWIGPRGVMALTFGGLHIAYGIRMGYKYGW
ncbi:MAG: hypothetical protein SFU56_22285 [Capsulimonadales bacterium]|nr:hypothetical protein [Capsulimonadales bacterium]